MPWLVPDEMEKELHAYATPHRFVSQELGITIM